jgi:hypothetical protein
MTGSFKLKEISPTVLGAIQAALNLGTQFNLGFGGEGRSAFIENNTFAAIEGQDVSSVSEKYLGTRRGPFGIPIPQTQTYVDNNPSVQGFVVSADAIAANEVLFLGQKVQTENGEEQGRSANPAISSSGAPGALASTTRSTVVKQQPRIFHSAGGSPATWSPPPTCPQQGALATWAMPSATSSIAGSNIPRPGI